MSHVVQFLEMLARGPQLSNEEFVTAVMQAGLEPDVRNALLTRDVAALSHILGGRRAMFCAIFPADNEEPDSEEKHDEETPEQESEPQSQAA